MAANPRPAPRPTIDLAIPEIEIPPPPFDEAEADGYAIVYCRISGSDDPRTASLATQALACIDRAYRAGYLVRPEDIYYERLTGFQSEEHRPLLIRARERLAAGEAQALVAYDTDRLARSDDLKFIVRHIERKGGKVFFVMHERTPGMLGDLVLDIKAYASSQEYVSIADRTERGRKDIRSFGKMVGPGPVRYGYRFNKEERRREVDPETAEVARLIFDLVGNKGYSTIDAAKYLQAKGIPSPYMARKSRQNKHKVTGWTATRVGYIVREETYLGYTFEGRTKPLLDEDGQPVKKMTGGRLRTVRVPVPREEWVVVPNSQTPALVDEALWRRANDQLDGNMTNTRAIKRNVERFFLLRGLLYCDKCEGRMTPLVCKERPNVRSRYIYQCATRRSKWRHGRECDSPQARAGELEEAVWSMIKRYVESPGLIEAEFERAKRNSNADLIVDESQQVEKDLKAAEKKLGQYVDAFAEADSKLLRDAVKEKIAEQKKEVARLESRLATLKLRLKPYLRIDETKAETLALAEKFRAGIDELDGPGRRKLLDALGVSVYAYQGKFRVKLTPPAGAGDSGVVASSPCSTARLAP